MAPVTVEDWKRWLVEQAAAKGIAVTLRDVADGLEVRGEKPVLGAYAWTIPTRVIQVAEANYWLCGVFSTAFIILRDEFWYRGKLRSPPPPWESKKPTDDWSIGALATSLSRGMFG